MSYRMIASGWMGSIKTNSTGSPTFFSLPTLWGVGGGIEKGLPYDSLGQTPQKTVSS